MTKPTKKATDTPIERVWAMPNRWTFKIKPIGQLLSRYVGSGMMINGLWADPFAGEHSPAQETNDINPKRPAKHHLHAEDFFKLYPDNHFDGILFDPPYSLTQLKLCYQNIGEALSQDETQSFPQNVKVVATPKLKPGGIVISFGWNSQGFGKSLGFELLEVLLVAHGRSHNDTIVTVERKNQ